MGVDDRDQNDRFEIIFSLKTAIILRYCWLKITITFVPRSFH